MRASADFGDQRADDLTQPLRDLGVLSRVLTVQRPRRDEQAQVLDNPRAGDTEGFARLVVRPDSSVLPKRGAPTTSPAR